MHLALAVDDILAIILQEFKVDERDSKATHKEWKLRLFRRTLAYLARTCKAFSSSALDALWMRQSSLMPVLKLLPTFQMVGEGRYVGANSSPTQLIPLLTHTSSRISCPRSNPITGIGSCHIPDAYKYLPSPPMGGCSHLCINTSSETRFRPFFSHPCSA